LIRTFEGLNWVRGPPSSVRGFVSGTILKGVRNVLQIRPDMQLTQVRCQVAVVPIVWPTILYLVGFPISCRGDRLVNLEIVKSKILTRPRPHFPPSGRACRKKGDLGNSYSAPRIDPRVAKAGFGSGQWQACDQQGSRI